MKKFFRFLGILVLLIVLVVVVCGLIAPKDVAIERSVTIKGPISVVREQMFSYENYKNWNPFDDEDPAIKTEITADGKKYSWEGPETGKGEMATTAQDDHMKTIDLHIIKPFDSKALCTYKVEDAGNDQTKAIQTFNMHSSFPFNGIMMLLGMKKTLEKTYEKGLNTLKEYVESGKAGTGTPAINIQEVQYPGATYATQRKTIGWSDMEKYFMEAYPMLGKAAGQRITGPAMALYYTWDTKNMQTDVAAGFPVSGTDAVKGATMITLPASQAYMVAYTGGYGGSVKVHEAIGKYMAEKGKTQSVVLEEYVRGKGEETDSNKYVTNIYYLLK